MINLVLENLTQTGLAYGLVGVTIRVYSWTVFAIILYFLYRTFKIKLKNTINLKIHYLFLLAIPFFLSSTLALSINPETANPLLLVDVMIFIGGILTLITFTSIYFYLKGEGDL